MASSSLRLARTPSERFRNTMEVRLSAVCSPNNHTVHCSSLLFRRTCLGLFLGNKIRCELSHGSGKVSKFSGEPGICFKCRLPGHWARECPNPPV